MDAPDYHHLLRSFVSLHARGLTQRSAEWFRARVGRLGGSELATAMGWNRYKTRERLVAEKAGVKFPVESMVACWWGTLLEPVAERAAELALGTRLVGTDITIPAPAPLEGIHANSPDGFGAVRFAVPPTAEHARYPLQAGEEPPAGWAAEVRPVLFEFKCPWMRIPKAEIPKNYQPQVWSGIELSPVDGALFTDSLFRRCGLHDLGPSRRCAHQCFRDGFPKRNEDPPLAWGLIGLYAPRYGAPAAMTAGPTRVVYGMEVATAWPAELAELLRRANEDGRADLGEDVADLGCVSDAVFEAAMAAYDAGGLAAGYLEPRFADGRGGAWAPREGLAELERRAPEDRVLFGVFPWKLFVMDFVWVEPRRGFLRELEPVIRGVLADAAKLAGAGDPQAAYFGAKVAAEQAAFERGERKIAGVSWDDALELFAAADAAKRP